MPAYRRWFEISDGIMDRRNIRLDFPAVAVELSSPDKAIR